MSEFDQSPSRSPRDAEFTGRYLLVGTQANDASFPRLVRDRAGITVASASDFTGAAVDPRALAGADGIYFERVGVVVATLTPDQLTPRGTSARFGESVIVERERRVYPHSVPRLDNPGDRLPTRVGLSAPRATESLVTSGVARSAFRTMAIDEAAVTWGLTATRVGQSRFTGKGVRVAVLDTGLDLEHPDFAGRRIVSHSFIEGEGAQDKHGHGTHTAGTAGGSSAPGTLPRYGVAPNSELYIGKVLNNGGRGTDGTAIAGINWALTNACRVISMSLGSAATVGQKHSEVYETVAKRARAANALIVASAGNDSDRPNNQFTPVGSPANCPSIIAVGALDEEMHIAWFSCRGLNPDGGQVDIAAPGVNVHSSVPMPGRYGRKMGTSMACPHVSGIAALFMEAYPNADATEVWRLILANVKKIDFDAADVGAGLVQAPV